MSMGEIHPIHTQKRFNSQEVLVTQSCLILWDPMDRSLPGSSVHGILQIRILEWVAMPFSISRQEHCRNFSWIWCCPSGTKTSLCNALVELAQQQFMDAFAGMK